MIFNPAHMIIFATIINHIKRNHLFKFIGGALGYFLMGKNFFGGIVGFVIGSVIDNYAAISAQIKSKGGSQEDFREKPRRTITHVSRNRSGWN